MLETQRKYIAAAPHMLARLFLLDSLGVIALVS
jgi:hypothetical protein